MTTDGIPGGESLDATMVMRGDRAWVSTNGSWTSVPVPPELKQAEGSASLGSAAFQELASYVRDIRVTEHQLMNGKPSTIIAGEIDTAGLLQATTKLGSFSKLSGAAPPELQALEGFDFGNLSTFGIELGDVSAVLTIDESSHLLSSALVRLTVKLKDETMELRLGYRLTSSNAPVELPAAPAS